jgi:hypothetical protein
MDEQTIERLRAQLEQVWPIFDDFNTAHGFHYARDVGNYPRVRIERSLSANGAMWLEFWMTLDDAGRYRESCTDDTPYELSGGVSFERIEGDATNRYYMTHAIYTARPFRSALATLRGDLETLFVAVGTNTREQVLSSGIKVRIDPVPR